MRHEAASSYLFVDARNDNSFSWLQCFLYALYLLLRDFPNSCWAASNLVNSSILLLLTVSCLWGVSFGLFHFHLFHFHLVKIELPCNAVAIRTRVLGVWTFLWLTSTCGTRTTWRTHRVLFCSYCRTRDVWYLPSVGSVTTCEFDLFLWYKIHLTLAFFGVWTNTTTFVVI